MPLKPALSKVSPANKPQKQEVKMSSTGKAKKPRKPTNRPKTKKMDK